VARLQGRSRNHSIPASGGFGHSRVCAESSAALAIASTTGEMLLGGESAGSDRGGGQGRHQRDLRRVDRLQRSLKGVQGSHSGPGAVFREAIWHHDDRMSSPVNGWLPGRHLLFHRCTGEHASRLPLAAKLAPCLGASTTFNNPRSMARVGRRTFCAATPLMAFCSARTTPEIPPGLLLAQLHTEFQRHPRRAIPSTLLDLPFPP